MQISACRGQQRSKSNVRLQEAWNWPLLSFSASFCQKMKKKRKKTYFLCIKWEIWAVEGRLHTHTNKKPSCCYYSQPYCLPADGALAIVANGIFSCFQDIVYWASRVWFSGSRDVIGRLTIRFPIGHFLLVVLWNQASISNGFGDI